MDFMQSIGPLLIPLVIPLIGGLYLYLAFSHEDYVNEKGRAYFHELHPDASIPNDASFWCLKKIERERVERKLKKENKKRKKTNEHI